MSASVLGPRIFPRVSFLIPIIVEVIEDKGELILFKRLDTAGSRRHVGQRAHESEHESTLAGPGSVITEVQLPIIIMGKDVSDVQVIIILETICCVLGLSTNLCSLTIVTVVYHSYPIGIFIGTLVLQVNYTKIDSVGNTVTVKSVLECECTIGSVSGVGVVSDVEGDLVRGIRVSLGGNDVVDMRKRCGRNLVKRVGTDVRRNERNVGGRELVVVEGLVESHDGKTAVGRNGVPVTVGVTVDGEIAAVVDGSDLTVVGVDVRVGAATGLVLISEIGTVQNSTVILLSSPGEVQFDVTRLSSVRNRLAGIVSVTGVCHPGIVLVHPEFNLGCGRGSRFRVRGIRINNGCEDAGNHDHCDHNLSNFHSITFLSRTRSQTSER